MGIGVPAIQGGGVSEAVVDAAVDTAMVGAAPDVYTLSTVRTPDENGRIFDTYAAIFAHAEDAGRAVCHIRVSEDGSPALSWADIPASSSMAIVIMGSPYTVISVSGTAPDADDYTWVEVDGPTLSQSADCYLGRDRTLVMRSGQVLGNGHRWKFENVDMQLDGGVVLNNVNFYADDGEYLGLFAPDVYYNHRRSNAAHPMLGNIDYIEAERFNGWITAAAASPAVTFEPTGSIDAIIGGTCRDDRVGTFLVFSGMTGGEFMSLGFVYTPNSATNTLHDATTETTPSGTLTLPLADVDGDTPSIVQSKIKTTGSNNITLDAAPTNGNMLCAICFNPDQGGAGAGWTLRALQAVGSPDYGLVVTKVAGAGESATQTPINGAVGGTGAIIMWELTPCTYVTASTPSQGSGPGVAGPALPNVENMIALHGMGSVDNISALYNVVQDQLNNANTRKAAGGHSFPSTGAMAQLLATVASTGAYKTGSALFVKP